MSDPRAMQQQRQNILRILMRLNAETMSFQYRDIRKTLKPDSKIGGQVEPSQNLFPEVALNIT
jgi:hypothetical protein